MKITWLKSNRDNENFRMFQTLGMDVKEIEDLEQTDNIIADLIKQHYSTIVLSNEVASFSEDIVRKYGKRHDVNIIITPSKEKLD